MGLSKVELDNGYKINTETIYSPKITDLNTFASWLRDNGSESIIKEEILFEKGEVDDKLIGYLSEGGYHYKRDIGVHPSTLKAFIKRHKEESGTDPDGLELAIFERAKVTAPKETL
jgi:hypothetical protein